MDLIAVGHSGNRDKSPVIMTMSIVSDTCTFDSLFSRSVPHILKKIFFSLDIKSFDTCRKVCYSWQGLLSGEAYKKRYEEMLAEKREIEERLLEAARAKRKKWERWARLGLALTGVTVGVALVFIPCLAPTVILSCGAVGSLMVAFAMSASGITLTTFSGIEFDSLLHS